MCLIVQVGWIGKGVVKWCTIAKGGVLGKRVLYFATIVILSQIIHSNASFLNGDGKLLFISKATQFNVSQLVAKKEPPDFTIRKLMIGRLTLSKFFPADPLLNFWTPQLLH